MKLHLPYLLRRCLLAGLSIAVPYAFLTLPTTHAAQSVSADDCAYYQKYYLDNGKYYIAVVSGGSVSGGGSVDYTVPSSAVGAYGYKNTSIGNGTGSALNVSIQGPCSYGVSGGSLTNGGTVDITADTAGTAGGAYGFDSTIIVNEAGATLTLTAQTASGNPYGIHKGALTNNGMVDISVESTNSHAWGIWGTSIANEAGGMLMVRSRGGNNAYGLDNTSLTNRGLVEITAEDYSIYNTSISNEAGATLTLVGRVYNCEKNITNNGTLSIDVGANSSGGYGILASSLSLSNGASGTLTLCHKASGTATGIYYLDACPSINSGIMDIMVESSSGGANGLDANSNSSSGNIITNESTGSLTIQSRGAHNTYGLYNVSLVNNGAAEIRVESTDDYACGISASYITNGTGSFLTIQSNGSYATDGISVYSLTNRGKIEAHAQGEESVYGILAHNRITNHGMVDITSESSSGAAYGFSSRNGDNTITNEAGGTLKIQSIGNAAYGMTGPGACSLVNCGIIDITAEASSAAARGFSFSGADLTNEASGTMLIQSCGNGATSGIFAQGENYLTNRGIVAITAESTTSTMYGIYGERNYYSTSGKTCATTNSADASLTIRGRGRDNSYGIYYGSLSNEGSVDISVESTEGAAYGTYRSSVSNKAGGTLEIQSKGSSSAYGIYGSLSNSGRLETHAQAEESAYGLYLDSSWKAVNEQGGYLAASGSTAGVFIYYSGRLYNAGELRTDSIHLVTSAAAHMLDGSTAGGLTEGADMSISGAGTLHLGGVRGDDGTVTGLATGSRINMASGLSLAQGVTLSLVDDVTLSMGGNLTASSVNRNGHRLTVDNGEASHRVTMGNSVAANWNGAVAVAHEARALKLSSEGGNTMSNGALKAEHITVESAADTSMVLEDMALTVSGDEIALTNIVVSGDCSFESTTGALTLNVEGVTFVLDTSNSSGMGMEPVAFFSADPLTETAVAPSVFYIGSDMLAGVNVAGNMTLDLSHWAEAIKAGGYENITLTFAETMAFGEGAQVQATLDGVNVAMADYTGDNMVQFNVANLPIETVPEPATPALSLLALTVLAARRRRK